MIEMFISNDAFSVDSKHKINYVQYVQIVNEFNQLGYTLPIAFHLLIHF